MVRESFMAVCRITPPPRSRISPTAKTPGDRSPAAQNLECRDRAGERGVVHLHFASLNFRTYKATRLPETRKMIFNTDAMRLSIEWQRRTSAKGQGANVHAASSIWL